MSDPSGLPERDAELIQGGSISGLDQDDVRWRPEKHHAETASHLASILVWVLIGTFGAHYLIILVLSLAGKESTVETLKSLYGVWIPVISGFVGGAVTYYFTKERKS